MRDATLLHNAILRSTLKQYKGYEVVHSNERNTGEGAFCMAFTSTTDALEWCMAVQVNLLTVSWPEQLVAHRDAAEELYDDLYIID